MVVDPVLLNDIFGTPDQIHLIAQHHMWMELCPYLQV